MSSRDGSAAWIEEQDVDGDGIASCDNASRRSVSSDPCHFAFRDLSEYIRDGFQTPIGHFHVIAMTEQATK